MYIYIYKIITVSTTGDATAAFVFLKSTEVDCLHRHKRYILNTSKKIGLKQKSGGAIEKAYSSPDNNAFIKEQFSIRCIYAEI